MEQQPQLRLLAVFRQKRRQKRPVPAEAQVLPGHGDFSTFGQEAATNFYIKNALRNA